MLTGTPMENLILDLCSIFDAGLLGKRARSSRPPRNADCEGKKQESDGTFATAPSFYVASLFPKKVGANCRCPLSVEQREVHSQVMDDSQRKVLSCLDVEDKAANSG